MGLTRFSSIKTFSKGGTLLPKPGKILKLYFGGVNQPVSGSSDDTGNFVIQFVYQPVTKLNVNDPIRGYVFYSISKQLSNINHIHTCLLDTNSGIFSGR
jgi:hypothetical protein